ncbi:hypothetical protein [Nannocystis pusilla]|uniref:hypothetical protein n=1 Tax=Nannocystis pusilla TaxID=889268 RepID=UPI003B75F366
MIDGHVWLGPDRPGLGVHLHRALGEAIPVVGVAKNPFRGRPRARCCAATAVGRCSSPPSA